MVVEIAQNVLKYYPQLQIDVCAVKPFLDYVSLVSASCVYPVAPHVKRLPCFYSDELL